MHHAGGVARFDPMTERHHHLVCEACGRLVDLDDTLVPPLRLPEASGHGLPHQGLLRELHRALPGLREEEEELNETDGRIEEDGETMAKDLKGTKTHENLKDAFAGESQANRRYLYFAKVADIEGYPEIAGNFRETADGETGHAHGHLDYLKQVGDPATGLPIGDTALNLKASVAGETHEYTDMYPGMAKTAREEGFSEVADWFETLAKAEKSHAGRFQKLLGTIS